MWDPLCLGLCCRAGLDYHHPNAGPGGGSQLPVREVRVCVLDTLRLLWKRGLLSLSSFLKSPGVPGDIPETPVTDALKVTR